MTLALLSAGDRVAARVSGGSSQSVDADLERALMEGLTDHETAPSADSGSIDFLEVTPGDVEPGGSFAPRRKRAEGEDFETAPLDGRSDVLRVSSDDPDTGDLSPDSNSSEWAEVSDPGPGTEIDTDFETVLLQGLSIELETLRAPLNDPRPLVNSGLPDPDPGHSAEEAAPGVPDEAEPTDADPPEVTELPASDRAETAVPIHDELESALLAGLAAEPASAPERSDDPGTSYGSLAAESSPDAGDETPDPNPVFDFEDALLEGLPDGPPVSFDEADPPDLPEAAAPMPAASPAPSDAALPDSDDFASELLDGLSDSPEVSSGDPEPPDLPAVPNAGDASFQSSPVEPPRFPDELPDPELDTAYTDGDREDADHRPATALAFATDPETERALREGLLRYESPSSGLDEPQVWPGGIRAAISALADGHSSVLIIVDLDGIPFPVGAIHELAEVCEPGTAVIALGSENTARVSREMLLAGVSDYLVKPVTAEAVREAALRATGAGDASPARGCVAGFAGTGGSGATTLAAATALHAAAEGRYVSVLDLNRRVSAMGLLLDIEPAPGLDQLFEVADRSSPDSKLLDGVRTERSERISVYAYRLGTSLPPVPSMAALDWLLGQLRRRSQLVLVDGLEDPETRFNRLGELDLRVLVVEPTPAGCARAARMAGLLEGRTPMLLVQNHTRKFGLDAGTTLLTETGVKTPPDAAVPFDASLPELASRGWPGERLPRGLRKPVAALGGRIFARAFDAAPAALAARA